MTLALLILMPLIAAIVVAAAPKQQAKNIALLGTLAPIAWFLSMLSGYAWSGRAGDQFSVADVDWFAPLGIKLSLGADNVSMLLVALTLLLGPICVLASFTAISERVKTYYAWLLVLQAAMTGVFIARDLVLFYVFFEFTLVPMYILISLYGSTNRKAAATKFFLFTFTGSILTLAAMIFVAWKHAEAHAGVWSFAFADLEQTARALPLATQTWVFLGFMAGFAVKVPLFPVHTWLPLAHTEAPTAGSVILAGVLLKLGTYGIYRFGIGFTPDAAWDLAPCVALLAIIGILYGGLICWVQTDVKKLVAYSSVSHLGFCVLGAVRVHQHRDHRVRAVHDQPRAFDRGPVPPDRHDVRAVPHPLDEGAGGPRREDAHLGDVHGVLRDGVGGAAGAERVCVGVHVPAGRLPGGGCVERSPDLGRAPRAAGALVRVYRRDRDDHHGDLPAVHARQDRVGEADRAARAWARP